MVRTARQSVGSFVSVKALCHLGEGFLKQASLSLSLGSRNKKHRNWDIVEK